MGRFSCAHRPPFPVTKTAPAQPGHPRKPPPTVPAHTLCRIPSHIPPQIPPRALLRARARSTHARSPPYRTQQEGGPTLATPRLHLDYRLSGSAPAAPRCGRGNRPVSCHARYPHPRSRSYPPRTARRHTRATAPQPAKRAREPSCVRTLLPFRQYSGPTDRYNPRDYVIHPRHSGGNYVVATTDGPDAVRPCATARDHQPPGVSRRLSRRRVSTQPGPSDNLCRPRGT